MRTLAATLLLLAGLGVTTDASTHSASDAYLNLDTVVTAPGASVIRGQWDIALRDLDFVLRLDANGDGRITWREVRTRWPEIERYAYAALAFKSAGRACRVTPAPPRVAEHADGMYAALFFEVACPPAGATVAPAVSLDYRLFFPIDPSHRAIVVWRRAGDVSTALLSPARTSITVGSGAR